MKVKCWKCGEDAVCLFPCIDPDIESMPYCRKCVEEAKNKVMEKIREEQEKNNI